MAQTKYSANLAAADFTLSFSYKGQSVIIPGPDQNYFQGTANWAGSTPQRGINIPQIMYCENTVPTAEGYRSVAYKYFVDPIPDQPTKVTGYLSVFDGQGRSAVLAVTSNRQLWILSAYTSHAWVKISGSIESAWLLPGQVTTAVVNGQVVILINTVGAFIIDLVNNTLVPQLFDGLTTDSLHGICTACGYLIAWEDETIYWSSTEDPFDFVPSLITGAGSAQVTGMKGTIRLCKELSRGFIIYTDVHIISAAYSSNLAIPWIFESLAGGSGIKWSQHVSEDINNQIHFVWSAGGILAVELNKITPQFPQVTDLIASGTLDMPATGTGYPTISSETRARAVKLSIISARYLCISVGVEEPIPVAHYEVSRLTTSFLYDLQLKRWGKLNITHAQIIEAPFQVEQPVFFLTSKLYPIEAQDAVKAGFVPESGLIQYPVENLETSFSLTGGTWFEYGYIQYNTEIEGIEAAFQLTGGTWFEYGYLSINQLPEAVNTSFELLGGSWISYGYIAYTAEPEILETSFELLGGAWT